MHGLGRGAGLVAAAVVALVLGGCAVGTGGGAGAGDDANYDPNAELSGELSVMGSRASTGSRPRGSRYAEAELGDVEVELIEGDLDIQQFLSAVAIGDRPNCSTRTATRSARSPRAAPSSRSNAASRARASRWTSSASGRSSR